MCVLAEDGVRFYLLLTGPTDDTSDRVISQVMDRGRPCPSNSREHTHVRVRNSPLTRCKPRTCPPALKIKFLQRIIFLVIRKYTCSQRMECSDAMATGPFPIPLPSRRFRPRALALLRILSDLSMKPFSSLSPGLCVCMFTPWCWPTVPLDKTRHDKIR